MTACVALAFGCEQQTEVQRQTRDLQEAQKNVAKETQELEKQLEQAKADVVRLDQKVALARQGLTDDVLENQKELQAALQAQEHRVENELGEAKREAQIHVRDTEAALKTMGQTAQPGEPAALQPVAPIDPAAVPPGEAPREDMLPVRGVDPEPTGTAAPVPPPVVDEGTAPEGVTPGTQNQPAPSAPPQPTSPVTDPTGAVPPQPPPPAPVDPAPAPVPAQP